MHTFEAPPVIIAACNEEELIMRTLNKLPASTVKPIIAVNGSTDRTADIAAGFGAEVIELEQQGKLPAQQEAVRCLRDRGHLPQDPILFMDADSYPLFPSSWAKIMSNRYSNAPQESLFMSGLTGFTDGNVAVNALRTARRFQRAAKVALRYPKSLDTVFGINMAVTFSAEEVRQQFLDMPHIWPGEDRATAQLILNAGGKLYQSLDPRSLVLASARYNVPFTKRLRHGTQYVRAHHEADYAARSAPTATHRFDPDSRMLVALSSMG